MFFAPKTYVVNFHATQYVYNAVIMIYGMVGLSTTLRNIPSSEGVAPCAEMKSI